MVGRRVFLKRAIPYGTNGNLSLVMEKNEV